MAPTMGSQYSLASLSEKLFSFNHACMDKDGSPPSRSNALHLFSNLRISINSVRRCQSFVGEKRHPTNGFFDDQQCVPSHDKLMSLWTCCTPNSSKSFDSLG